MSLDPPLITAIMPQRLDYKSKDISTATARFTKSAQNFWSEQPVHSMCMYGHTYNGYRVV